MKVRPLFKDQFHHRMERKHLNVHPLLKAMKQILVSKFCQVILLFIMMTKFMLNKKRKRRKNFQ